MTTPLSASSRMAVRAVEALRERREPLRDVDDLVDRILWGRNTPDAEARRALSVASLFQVVEAYGDGATDLTVIAPALGEQSETRMREHLERFKSRGIVVEGGRFVQVQPAPLASHLGKQHLKALGAAKLGVFFNAASASLQQRLLERVKLFDTAPEAQTFARELLKEEAIGNLDALNTEFGSRSLDRLVHVAPSAAMDALHRLLGDLTIDQLKTLKAGRRHIVWALEKLVFRRDTFDKAARLLLQLAAAENEDWGNNASGQFKQLFQLHLSGTEAEPAMRLHVLDDGLISPDNRVQDICIEALGEMLTTHGYTRGGGAEAIGTQRPLRDWRPELVGDQWQFFREAISRLSNLATGGGRHASAAKRLLAQNIRGLLRVLPFEDVAAVVHQVTQQEKFWIAGLRGLNDWLYFDRRKAPPELGQKVRALHDQLMPTDILDRAILYASGWDTDFHDPNSEYKKNDTDRNDFYYASRMAAQVAEEIARGAAPIDQCLDRVTTATLHNGYGFGKRLAECAADPVSLLNGVLLRAQSVPQLDDPRFLCGVLAGLESRSASQARAGLARALGVASLIPHRTRLMAALSTQSNDIPGIVDLLRRKEINVERTVELSWGKGLDDLPPDAIVPLLEELERHGGAGMWAVLNIIHMYLHSRQDLPLALATISKRTLISPIILEGITGRHTHDVFAFEEEYKRLRRHGHVDSAFARSMTEQAIRAGRVADAAARYELDEPTTRITTDLIQTHPVEVWEVVTSALGNATGNDAQNIRNAFDPERDDRTQAGPLFGVPQEHVLAWVREFPSERAGFVAAWLPLVRSDSGSRQWHPVLKSFVEEFAHIDGVLSAVTMRLYPGGWSGSIVPHLEPWLPLLDEWSTHNLAPVREWAIRTARWLREWIAKETARDAEDNLGIF